MGGAALGLLALVALAIGGRTKKRKPGAGAIVFEEGETVYPWPTPEDDLPYPDWPEDEPYPDESPLVPDPHDLAPIDPLEDERLEPGEGNPPQAWVVGDPNDPEIDALLREMENLYISAGIPKVGWSAYDLTVMNKAPGKPVAIPHPDMWWNMVPTLGMFVELREHLGFPLLIRNGYRPPDYNAAVSGSNRSLHQWHAALDISSNDRGERNELAEAAAILFLDSPDEPIGLGIYGEDNSAGRTHIDYGWRRRTWDNTDAWL